MQAGEGGGVSEGEISARAPLWMTVQLGGGGVDRPHPCPSSLPLIPAPHPPYALPRAPLASRPELGDGGNLRPVVDLLVEQVLGGECRG